MKHFLLGIVFVSVLGSFSLRAEDPAVLLANALQNMQKKSYVANYRDPQGVSQTIYQRVNSDGTIDSRREFLHPDGDKTIYINTAGKYYYISPHSPVIQQKWLEDRQDFSDENEELIYSLRGDATMDGRPCYEIKKTIVSTDSAFEKYAKLPQGKHFSMAELRDFFPVVTLYYIDKDGMFLRGKRAYNQEGKLSVETRYGDIIFRDDLSESLFAIPKNTDIYVAADPGEQFDILYGDHFRAQKASSSKRSSWSQIITWGVIGIAGVIALLLLCIYLRSRKRAKIS